MVRRALGSSVWRSRFHALAVLSFVVAPSLAQQQSGATASARAESQVGARRLQVLFLGAPTQNGPHHDPITRYATLKRGLGTAGIDLTYSEDPADALSSPRLAQFDALLLYGNWDMTGAMPEPQLQALVQFVEHGGGFVPVHCASACWGRSPAFVRLVGGRFARHGGEEFTVENVLPTHPALAGSPSFRAWDETYEHDEHGTDRVILQTRQQEPWTWVRTQGKGRVFYTAAGHDHRVWDLPEFQTLLQNAILWAVGDERRALLDALALPRLEDEVVSLPGYKTRREITRAQKPLSPSESQKLHQVPVGFELQLFASEPDVVNPIHVAWDVRGRAFVVETIDYPNNLHRGDLGHDRITICEDTDGDGKADRFTRFAEGLSIPTSLVFANGGVLCTNGADVLFLQDTDGDDRADVRKVLFSGIGIGDTHAGVSNLRWAPDGWIWATVGYSGFDGEVGGKRQSFAQGVFRFRPDGSAMEFVQHTTNNTWGLGFTSEFDVVGSTANGNPSWYLTFADAAYRAVGAEPHHTPRADEDPIFFPASRDVRQVDFFDRFTSAAGHAICTTTRFPEGEREHTAYVCEPTGKLVARFALQRHGAGFRAVQSPNNLFCSADAWSSPVCAEVGPDGAVWICDWYNLVIQHNPTPTKGSAGIDAKTGRGNAYETPLRDTQHGRIWRVFPRGSSASTTPDLAAAKGRVDALRHENQLWRSHAQRLLVESKDVAAKDALIAAVADPVAGLHALHALHQLGLLRDDVAEAALRSPQRGTRRAAIALADVAAIKRAFVTGGAIALAGRELAEVLVRLSEGAADPEIGAAILATAQASEKELFAETALRDAWTLAARRHATTVLAAAKQAGVSFAVDEAPKNLLANADFEVADGDRPQHWTDLRLYSGAPRERIQVARTQEGRNGSHALRVETDRAADCGVAAIAQVEAGTRYRLSGFVRTAGVVPVRGSPGVMLNVHGGPGTKGVVGDHDWTEVSVEFEADHDGEAIVHCLFGGYGGARGTAWFDDVSLVALGRGNTLAGALRALAQLADPAAAAAEPKARAFAIDEAIHERGKKVFARTCSACHGIDGKGVPPVFPPLDGSDWLAGDAKLPIDIVLHGLMGRVRVLDKDYESVMAPLGAVLTDQEIADVLTLVRQSWSNDHAPVTEQQVAARRAATKGRERPFTAAELSR